MTQPKDSRPEIEIEAKPCPFCGTGGAKLTPCLLNGRIIVGLPEPLAWQMECEACGARGPWNEAGAWALVMWNDAEKRHRPASPSGVGEAG